MPYDISYNMYRKDHQEIADANSSTFKDIVGKAYRAAGVVPDDNWVLSIGVFFDGSWQRRGHSAHNGMTSVIDLLTGLPINHEVF